MWEQGKLIKSIRVECPLDHRYINHGSSSLKSKWEILLAILVEFTDYELNSEEWIQSFDKCFILNSVGHHGRFGHEFLEFEFLEDGLLRYANNSLYKGKDLLKKKGKHLCYFVLMNSHGAFILTCYCWISLHKQFLTSNGNIPTKANKKYIMWKW